MTPEDIKYIVVHCSDSPQGRGDDAATIHQWHVERDFDGIGYHRVILEDGTVQEGRPLYWPGAHARGFNSKSVGVCLIGRGDYTECQMKALKRLIWGLLDQFPGAMVVGHNDLDKNKTCPMFDVKRWWMDGA